MLKELKIQFAKRKKEMLVYDALCMGCWLFGLLLAIFLGSHTEIEEGMILVGTLIVMIMMSIVHFLGTSFSFVVDFNLAVSVGAVRKCYVPAYVLFTMAELAQIMLFIVLMGHLEKGILQEMFPKRVLDLDLTPYVDLKVCLAVIIGMTVLELFTGSLILCFGWKSLWGIWVLWMLPSVIAGILVQNEKLKSGMLALADRITGGTIVAITILLCLLLAIASWGMLRRQRVTV